MRLYVARHGQTAWNADGRTQGHSDVGLNEFGLAQAGDLALGLATEGIQAIWSSDLTRAHQTARAVADRFDLPVRVTKALRERSFGSLEGSPFSSVAEHMITRSAREGRPTAQIRPEGGESLCDVWHRLESLVGEIERFPDNLLVVTHGGTASVLVAKLLKANLESAKSFRLGNACVTVLERAEDGHYCLVRYNDGRHLEVLQAAQ